MSFCSEFISKLFTRLYSKKSKIRKCQYLGGGKHVSERLIAPYISLAVHTFQTDRAAGPTEPSTESMRTDSKIHAAGQTRRLLDTKIPSRRGAGQPSPGPLM